MTNSSCRSASAGKRPDRVVQQQRLAADNPFLTLRSPLKSGATPFVCKTDEQTSRNRGNDDIVVEGANEIQCPGREGRCPLTNHIACRCEEETLSYVITMYHSRYRYDKRNILYTSGKRPEGQEEGALYCRLHMLSAFYGTIYTSSSSKTFHFLPVHADEQWHGNRRMVTNMIGKI